MQRSQSRKLPACGAALLCLLALPQLAAAQPLADQLPDDAVLYVGWRGADDLGPGFADSRLKGFLDISAVPQLINDFLPKVIAHATERDRNVGQRLRAVAAFVPVIWKHPTALYVGPVQGLNQGVPVFHVALVCSAGPDAQALANQINQLLAQIPPDSPVPVRCTVKDGQVAVVIGEANIGAGDKTLSKRKEFLDTMAQLGKDPVAAAYVDVEAIVALIDANMPPNAQRESAMWAMANDVIGLRGLKRIGWTAGFDGKDWSTQAFVAAPAPRAGLLALADAPPVSDESLKAVPYSATLVATGRLDLAKILAAVRSAAEKIDPNARAQIEQGLQQLNGMIGVDLEKDVLQPLGDEWTLYSDPQGNGVGPLGLVAINHARDARKLEDSLANLEQMANRTIVREMRHEQLKPQFLQADGGGFTIHYLDTPIVTPSWGVSGGNLYIALYPQMVSTAAAAGHGRSILENEGFQSIRQRLGGNRACHITYVDLPRTAPLMYPWVLAGTRLLGFADMWGVQSPAMVLPPLDKLRPLLAPAGSATWIDDAGVHFKSLCPFPGSELLGAPEALAVPVLTFGAIGWYREAQVHHMAPATREAP